MRASLIGRMYPDAAGDPNKQELKKLLSAVAQNVPGLLREMQVGRAGQRLARKQIPNMLPGAGVLRANGPLVTKYMRMFAAKLGIALHFEMMRSPVPVGGGVQPMYFTNVNAARGELPMQLVELMPSSRTLEQGRKHVRDQFQYSYLLTGERQHCVFYAVFRESFAVAVVTALDRSVFLAQHDERFPITLPGDFKRQSYSETLTPACQVGAVVARSESG